MLAFASIFNVAKVADDIYTSVLQVAGYREMGWGTHDSVDNSLLPRELYILNIWMRLRQRNNRAIENTSLHSPTHHGVTEEIGDTAVAYIGRRITEVFLERRPIHAVVCFKKSEIREKSGVGCQHY